MVRELVTCQVGQCGNQMGSIFWETIRQEHNLDQNGKFESTKNKSLDIQLLDKTNVYFHETSKNKYVPRCCLIDLEPGTLDIIKSKPIGKWFKPDNLLFGKQGTGNNWAKGHFTDGGEILDDMLDVMRKEVEECDCMQGISLYHSLGGGTGSGLGTLLLLKMRDRYPDRITSSYSIFPSPKVSDVVVEPYNAILSIHHLLEDSDETFVIDNEALYNISHNILKQKNPRYSDLNWVISLVMSGITSSLRFPGKLNGDLRKLGVNLVPFPRLHFFTIAHAPLFAENEKNKMKLTIQELCDQMFLGDNLLCNINREDGKYMTASCMFRGKLSTQEIDNEMSKIQSKLAEEFVTYIPNNLLSSIINIPPKNTQMSSTFVGNDKSIKQLFQRITAQFAKMFKRKAFLHWYLNEGMDTMQFEESNKNVRDLITEYQDISDHPVFLDSDFDESEEEDDDYDDDEEEDE